MAVVALVVVRKIRAIPRKGANLPPETDTKKVRIFRIRVQIIPIGVRIFPIGVRVL